MSDSGTWDGTGAVVSEARLYSHLVTRQTGRAVRLNIERQIDARDGPVVTVVDFRNVAVIDFSCADEVVAKLTGTAVSGDHARELYFLFAGLAEHHVDPVDSALRRRELAAAGERIDGEPTVLGELDSEARRIWEFLHRSGSGRPDGVARELGVGRAVVEAALRRLCGRRLLLRAADRYVSLRRAVSEARTDDH